MDFVRTKRLRMVEPFKLQQLNPFRAKCISMQSKLELATAKHTYSSEETSKDMHGSVQIDIDHLEPSGNWLSYFTHHNLIPMQKKFVKTFEPDIGTTLLYNNMGNGLSTETYFSPPLSMSTSVH